MAASGRDGGRRGEEGAEPAPFPPSPSLMISNVGEEKGRDSEQKKWITEEKTAGSAK